MKYHEGSTESENRHKNRYINKALHSLSLFFEPTRIYILMLLWMARKLNFFQGFNKNSTIEQIADKHRH